MIVDSVPQSDIATIEQFDYDTQIYGKFRSVCTILAFIIIVIIVVSHIKPHNEVISPPRCYCLVLVLGYNGLSRAGRTA